VQSMERNLWFSQRNLLNTVRELFEKVSDQRSRASRIPLPDALMSVLAMFMLKIPSLLQLSNNLRDSTISSNLRSIFGIETAASDDQLRNIIDPIGCSQFHPIFSAIHKELRKMNSLLDFKIFGKYLLLAVDGTQIFQSKRLSSDTTQVKNHSNGETSYSVSLLSGCIVSPRRSTVFPVAPEPIQKADGMTKNDCETNAFYRFYTSLRKGHGKTKFCLLLDSLFSKTPTLSLIAANQDFYIAACKEGDHEYLFKTTLPLLDKIDSFIWRSYEDRIKGESVKIRFMNGVKLFKDINSVVCSFIEMIVTRKNGTKTRFTWVTNIIVNEHNALEICTCGRTRWRIENETFNTLKNHSYNLEHNYGLGKTNLRANLGILMMLAFLLDQLQEFGDDLFKKALKSKSTRGQFWCAVREIFTVGLVSSYDVILNLIAKSSGENVINWDDIVSASGCNSS
jgi:hypothetical protein